MDGLDRRTLKALFQNAVLMAFADGVFHPLQREFLKDLVVHAGIAHDEVRAWRAELEAGDLAFRPVTDHLAAVVVARVAIGTAAADGGFHDAEKHALLELGKAIGLDRDALQALVLESFGADVLAQVFPRGRASLLTPPPPKPACETFVLNDGFTALEAFLGETKALSPRSLTLSELLALGPTGGLTFFHLGSTTRHSTHRLQQIKRRHPSMRVVFVAERAQVFQIGYLLDEGAAGCLIAPVYADEISDLLIRLGKPAPPRA